MISGLGVFFLWLICLCFGIGFLSAHDCDLPVLGFDFVILVFCVLWVNLVLGGVSWGFDEFATSGEFLD